MLKGAVRGEVSCWSRSVGAEDPAGETRTKEVDFVREREAVLSMTTLF